jgi:alpha-1,2-mannosyltransferase
MGIDAPWLTARRIRVHGLLLVICMWSVYAADLATPGLRDRNGLVKGTDFLHFYTLGTLALHRGGQVLYDMQAQSTLAQKIGPGISATLYVPLYGPQVSLLFSPFALLPYGWALLAWLLLNAALYGLCVYAVWKTCPNLQGHGWTVLILAIAFPGFFHLVAWGQTSGLALACFTLAFLALRSHRLFFAGLAIGGLIFKPQLGCAAAVIFIMSGEGKIVLGAVISALAQLAVAWGYYGTAVMRDYWHALLHVREIIPLLEPRPYQMHSLRAFWSLLLPWPSGAFALYIASALAVLVLTFRVWKSKLPLGVRYSALLIATVLVSPHLTVYDLVILAPAFLWFADWTLESFGQRSVSAVPALLYACYPLFLLGPLTRFTHLQLSVPAMVALLWTSNAATLNTP